jgi:hypothetical protein
VYLIYIYLSLELCYGVSQSIVDMVFWTQICNFKLDITDHVSFNLISILKYISKPKFTSFLELVCCFSVGEKMTWSKTYDLSKNNDFLSSKKIANQF